MIVHDLRTKKKDKPDDFLVAAMFFKNLSSSPLKLVKFTRSGTLKRWDNEPVIKSVTMSLGKKDIIQNVYLVDGDRILSSGNFFTLLDINLVQLK